MTALIAKADVLLRPTSRLAFSPRTLLAMIILFGAFYGAMMGTFYVPDDRRGCCNRCIRR
jgi:hypothetical protein